MLTVWPRFVSGNTIGTRHTLSGDALRRGWAELLGRVPWHVFVTLTFDPKRVYPVTARRASREAFDWCNDMARMLRKPIAWVYAPERGRNGQWHVHVLIAGTDAKSLDAARAVWRTRNGIVDVQPVRSFGQATLYMTKEAALAGEITWSDTVGRYRDGLCSGVLVPLHP